MRLLLLLAVMTMLLAACKTEKKEIEKKAMLVGKMYEWPEEISFEMEIGKPERFILEENGSTGYIWHAEADEKVCGVALQRLPRVMEDGGLCGAPGEVQVTINPIAAGESDITMRYMRSWEPDDPAHLIKIYVVVK